MLMHSIRRCELLACRSTIRLRTSPGVSVWSVSKTRMVTTCTCCREFRAGKAIMSAFGVKRTSFDIASYGGSPYWRMIWLADVVSKDNWLLQRFDVNRHKGFIARRRADHVVSVDDGQLGLRRIWAISHDHLDYSRDCVRGRCRMARR